MSETAKRRPAVPLAAARGAALAARLASRALGRGATTVPGRTLLALRPQALAELSDQRRVPTICVSATNGKTTTTAILAEILRSDGRDVAHNLSGANLRSGIASALLTASSESDLSLFETDEAALDSVARDVAPQIVVLGNLFRDQLDRYGELDAIAQRWARMLESLGGATLVYNVDDPLIAHLVSTHHEGTAIGFGFDDAAATAGSLSHAADSKVCPACGTPLTYAASFIGHIGHYDCPQCSFTRPTPDVHVTSAVFDGLDGADLEITTPTGQLRARLSLPGLYNVYNAAAAVATATALGVAEDAIVDGLERFTAAFGRFERVQTPEGVTVTLLLVKNPVGLNEAVRTLADAGVELDATMFALNDQIADGRDISWIWDADIEPLLDRCQSVIVSGQRAAEAGLRFWYAGMAQDRIDQIDRLDDALDAVIERASAGSTQQAYALTTYTAMLDLHSTVQERGWTKAFWLPREEVAQ